MIISWLTILSLHWHGGQRPVGDPALAPGGTLVVVSVGGHHREPRVPGVLRAGWRRGQRGPTQLQVLAYKMIINQVTECYNLPGSVSL